MGRKRIPCVPCVQRINRALQVVFLSVSILFFLRAVGIRHELCHKVCRHVAAPQGMRLKAPVLLHQSVRGTHHMDMLSRALIAGMSL